MEPKKSCNCGKKNCPLPKANFTPLLNEAVEKIYSNEWKLCAREVRLLFYFFRNTVGFHKRKLSVYYAEIAKHIDVPRNKLSALIKSLSEKGLIHREGGGARERQVFRLGDAFFAVPQKGVQLGLPPELLAPKSVPLLGARSEPPKGVQIVPPKGVQISTSLKKVLNKTLKKGEETGSDFFSVSSDGEKEREGAELAEKWGYSEYFAKHCTKPSNVLEFRAKNSAGCPKNERVH